MDDYEQTIIDSCDDETQAAIRELLDDGYDLEDAILILEDEGLI